MRDLFCAIWFEVSLSYNIYSSTISNMKASVIVVSSLALSITGVAAFPTAMFDMMSRAENSQTTRNIEAAIAKIKEKRDSTPVAPGFNAAQQYVSTTGSHAFVAPNLAGGDQRGVCSPQVCTACKKLIVVSSLVPDSTPWQIMVIL